MYYTLVVNTSPGLTSVLPSLVVSYLTYLGEPEEYACVAACPTQSGLPSKCHVKRTTLHYNNVNNTP